MTKTLFVDTVYERTHKLAQRLQENYDSNSYANQYVFDIKEGRKYYKIYAHNQGVHAFVDIKTGDVYKPASYNKPAAHVRYNLLDDSSYNECLSRADWAGGYLYLR